VQHVANEGTRKKTQGTAVTIQPEEKAVKQREVAKRQRGPRKILQADVRKASQGAPGGRESKRAPWNN